MIFGLAPNSSTVTIIEMAYIISRNNRFYVVAYDGVDPATAPAATVLRRFPAELEVVLRRHGAPEAFITGELSTLGDTACHPTANRSMVGALNEYVCLAGYAHDDLGSTPDLVGLSDWLAQTPMGPLDKRHGSADRELAALTASA